MFSREERRGLWITVVGGGALLLALLTWLGFFADPPERAATTAAPPLLQLGAVRGRVVAAEGERGLALRVITVEGVAGRSDHRVLPPHAATPGAFEVRALPAGRCTLRLAADGHVDQQREVLVVAGTTVELPPVALLALVTLSGRVVDANATPVAAGTIEVVASAGAERRRVTTDEHGHFEFSGLQPAEWTLAAATADTAAAARDGTLQPLTLDARRGGAHRDLELRVVPEFELIGTIRWPVGAPPPRALTIDGRELTLPGDGSFRIGGLRAGSGRAAIRDGEGAWHERDFRLPAAPVEWSVPAPPAAMANVDAAAIEPANAPDALDGEAAPPPRLVAALPLRIEVLDANGNGVAARLELRPLESDAPAVVDATDRAGRATLADWPPGSWRLRADGATGVIERMIELRRDSLAESGAPVLLTLEPAP